MNNLKILLKTYALNLIGSFNKKKKNKSYRAGITSFAFMSILLLVIYGFSGWAMLIGFKGGLESVYIIHSCFLSFAVCLILGCARLSSNSKSNDNDLLMSLPLTKREIVLSKLTFRFITDLYLPIMLFGVYMLMYHIIVGFSFKIFILGLVYMLLLPLFSIGISNILDFIAYKVFNRFKKSSLLKSLLVVVVYIPVMFLIITKTSGYGNVSIENVDTFINSYWLIKYFYGFIVNPNLINIAITLGLFIVPFIIGLLLSSSIFGQNSANQKERKEIVTYSEAKSPFMLLLKKELSNYFSITAYVINTIIGPAIILLFAGFVAIKGYNGILDLLSLDIANLPKELAAIVASFVIMGVNSLTPIASCSISLEGRNIWLLKSTPVDPNDVINAKAGLQIVIAGVPSVIASIIISIACKFNITSTIAIIVLPLIYTALTSFGGVLINLLLPRLDWEEEIQPIKQSSAVLVYMLSGMLLVGIPVLILVFSLKLLVTMSNPYFGAFLIIAAVMLLMLAAILAILYTKGRKIFEKL